MRFVVGACLLAGCYSPSYKDCEIGCAMSHACPDGFSCDTQLGMCREQGVQGACGQGSAMPDAAADSKPLCFGYTLATNFDPCTLMGTMGDSTIETSVTYFTDTGQTIPQGSNVVPIGDLVQQSDGTMVRMVKFGSLTILPTGVLRVTGRYPLLIVAHTVDIGGAIDMVGTQNDVTLPGCNATPGVLTNNGGGGGGGGGFAARGGDGGDSSTNGVGHGTGGGTLTPIVTPLRTGCPGAKGGGGNVGAGGQGGGGLQITARDRIAVSGELRVGGSGGLGGAGQGNCSGVTCGAGGGGGGAGGVIFLEAPSTTITSSAKLCANGGGGGGGADAAIAGSGGLGAAGTCVGTGATGGASAGTNSGPGGLGGNATTPAGTNGTRGLNAQGGPGGGGGGGAVGRIVFHVGPDSPPADAAALISPPAMQLP